MQSLTKQKFHKKLISLTPQSVCFISVLRNFQCLLVSNKLRITLLRYINLSDIIYKLMLFTQLAITCLLPIKSSLKCSKLSLKFLGQRPILPILHPESAHIAYLSRFFCAENALSASIVSNGKRNGIL